MKKIIVLIIILIICAFKINNPEEYIIDELYQKIELDYGTLDENGDEISFIFVKTVLEEGTYEIEITDGPGDLYEIKGTNIFIEFTTYYGYAGYGEAGILKINSGYFPSIFYKIE